MHMCNFCQNLIIIQPMGILYNQHDHVTHENYLKDMQMILMFTNVANRLELFLHYSPHRMYKY